MKADASENMPPMSVTADTCHFDRSWLKVDASTNMDCMLVTVTADKVISQNSFQLAKSKGCLQAFLQTFAQRWVRSWSRSSSGSMKRKSTR